MTRDELKVRDDKICEQLELLIECRHRVRLLEDVLKTLHNRAYMRLDYRECEEIEMILGLPSVVRHELEDLKSKGE